MVVIYGDPYIVDVTVVFNGYHLFAGHVGVKTADVAVFQRDKDFLAVERKFVNLGIKVLAHLICGFDIFDDNLYVRIPRFVSVNINLKGLCKRTKPDSYHLGPGHLAVKAFCDITLHISIGAIRETNLDICPEFFSHKIIGLEFYRHVAIGVVRIHHGILNIGFGAGYILPFIQRACVEYIFQNIAVFECTGLD